MSLRSTIVIILGLCAIFGLIDGYYLMHNTSTPRAFELIFGVVVMTTAYFWYRRDSSARGYRGSVFLGGAIILFAPLGTPIYLALSRTRGNRLKSVLSYFGFLLLSLGVGMGFTFMFSIASGA